MVKKKRSKIDEGWTGQTINHLSNVLCCRNMHSLPQNAGFFGSFSQTNVSKAKVENGLATYNQRK